MGVDFIFLSNSRLIQKALLSAVFIFQMPGPFNAVASCCGDPNHKSIFLTTHNCKFAVMDYNVNICVF